MVVWDVRWRTPRERITTTRMLRMPFDERPAVVLPIQSSVAQAREKILHLAHIFPEIHITINSHPDHRAYAKEVLQYARRGFSTVQNGRMARTTFGVNGSGVWTPEHAYQILGMVHLAAAGRGEIEQPFPEELVETPMNTWSPEVASWQALTSAYRLNGLIVYAQFPNNPADTTGTLERFLRFANGPVLQERTQVAPIMPYDINARWIGVVDERNTLRADKKVTP